MNSEGTNRRSYLNSRPNPRPALRQENLLRKKPPTTEGGIIIHLCSVLSLVPGTEPGTEGALRSRGRRVLSDKPVLPRVRSRHAASYSECEGGRGTWHGSCGDSEHGQAQKVGWRCSSAEIPELTPHPTYLWGHPVLPAGGLGLDHTLGPGSDVARTVVGVALEDQLARAFLAGKEGTEHHAISHAVQDLKPGKEKLQRRTLTKAGRPHSRREKRARPDTDSQGPLVYTQSSGFSTLRPPVHT